MKDKTHYIKPNVVELHPPMLNGTADTEEPDDAPTMAFASLITNVLLWATLFAFVFMIGRCNADMLVIPAPFTGTIVLKAGPKPKPPFVQTYRYELGIPAKCRYKIENDKIVPAPAWCWGEWNEPINKTTARANHR